MAISDESNRIFSASNEPPSADRPLFSRDNKRNALPSAAKRICRHYRQILERWHSRIRSRPPGDPATVSRERPGPLPFMLFQLVTALSTAPRPGSDLSELPEFRELQKLALPSSGQDPTPTRFTLASILSEYFTLRETLFEILDENEALTPGERNQILDAVERGMIETSRRFAETEQSAAERVRENFLSHPGLMLAMASGDGYFKELNPIWEKNLGWTLAELTSRPWIDFVHPEDRVSTEAARLRLSRGETVLDFRNRYRCRDGRYHWLQWSARPIGNEFYSFAHDVTDAVETEAALQQSIEQLKNEHELRERFVETLTHDLRTPLTVVRASAELLPEVANSPAIVRDLAGRMLRNIDRVALMIRNLLDANRIKAGQPIAISVAYDRLDEVAQKVAGELNEVHGPRFKVHCTPPTPLEANFDREAVTRILENLGDNAVKYGTPEAPITISLRRDGEWAEIAVHNEGKPIPEADQKILFHPYRRTGAAQSGGQSGWGLGLALVQGLVATHQGTVRLESTAENGTTFFVRLPRQLATGRIFGNSPPDRATG